jgi:hypothetical protein
MVRNNFQRKKKLWSHPALKILGVAKAFLGGFYYIITMNRFYSLWQRYTLLAIAS